MPYIYNVVYSRQRSPGGRKTHVAFADSTEAAKKELFSIVPDAHIFEVNRSMCLCGGVAEIDHTAYFQVKCKKCSIRTRMFLDARLAVLEWGNFVNSVKLNMCGSCGLMKSVGKALGDEFPEGE